MQAEDTAPVVGSSSDAPSAQSGGSAQDVGAAVARGVAGGVAKGVGVGMGKRLWKAIEDLFNDADQ